MIVDPEPSYESKKPHQRLFISPEYRVIEGCCSSRLIVRGKNVLCECWTQFLNALTEGTILI